MNVLKIAAVCRPSGALFVFFMILLGCGGIACSRTPEEPSWFQATSSGETLDGARLTAIIRQTDSLFDLYDMKREYILRGGDSPEIMQELDRRRDQLAATIERFSAIPGKLDFLGWDIRKVAGNRYRISCYFVVVGKMDRDWILKLMAKVDEKHAHLLPPENQVDGRMRWQVYPKTSTWDPGEHKIIAEIVELQPIPYDIFARFFLWPEDTYQDAFSYGWFADPDSAAD